MDNHRYSSILCLGGIPSISCTTFFSTVSSHTGDMTSFTQYLLRFAFVFGKKTPLGTFMYMSESNDLYKYAVTTSINYKNRCFCIVRDIRYQKVIPFITGEYVSLKSTPSLYVKSCTTSLALYLTTSLFSFLF
jgi:hypothetical protein